MPLASTVFQSLSDLIWLSILHAVLMKPLRVRHQTHGEDHRLETASSARASKLVRGVGFAHMSLLIERFRTGFFYD